MYGCDILVYVQFKVIDCQLLALFVNLISLKEFKFNEFELNSCATYHDCVCCKKYLALLFVIHQAFISNDKSHVND